MNAIAPAAHFEPDFKDPALLGWPPTLPIEVAMREMPIARICEHYGISRDTWGDLRQNPAFQAEVAAAVEALKKEGVTFKMKAKLQSEELLKTSWRMIHDPTDSVPPSVRADLIKFTIRAAGLDGSKEAAAVGQQAPLQIQIIL
jgi:hypothetical protein